MLIIFGGLPGVGKSTLSKRVAQRIGAAYVRIDSIEEGLLASALAIRSAEDAGYVVGYAVADDNLRVGRTVVADSVNPIEVTRAAWLDVAERVGCPTIEIEVICSDEAEHRRRVEQRYADFPTEHWPRWQDVIDREYHAWTRDRFVVDTAVLTVEDGVEAILERLSDGGAY